MQASTELMGGIIATPIISSGSRDAAMGPPAARLMESPGKGAKQMMTTPQSVLDPSALATPDSAATFMDGPSPISSVPDGQSPLSFGPDGQSPLSFQTPKDLMTSRLLKKLATHAPPNKNLTFRGFLDMDDPSSPSGSVSTPKLSFSDSPASDALPQKGAPHRLSNSDPTPFLFEPSPLKVSAKKMPSVPRVSSSSDLTNEMRRISLARPSPAGPPSFRDLAVADPELSSSSSSSQQGHQQSPITVSSPVKKQDDTRMLVSPFANSGTEDLPPWATPTRKASPPKASPDLSTDAIQDSAYHLSRRRSSNNGNSDFLRDIFRLGCQQHLPDYVMRDRDDSPINYAAVKQASGDLCEALNLLSKPPGGTSPASGGTSTRTRSRSNDGNGNSPPIALNLPQQRSHSEDWANNGMRMLNRAPSAYGASEDEINLMAIDASSPHTPHSPDPALIIQGTPWGGDCPPTPAQQRIRTGRMRISEPVSPSGMRSAMSSRESLKDDKVLIQTSQLIMERTESYIHPEMFKFQNHFDFVRALGNSKLSEVWEVRHKTRGDMYAIKKTRREFQTKADRERCMREILAVAALPTNPNVVGQYRAWQQGGHFYIQMDLCSGGSLAGILQKLRAAGEQLEEEAIWAIMRDVSQGLQFLHSHGVTHLDIKPDNIYKDGQGRFKVGDFGQAVLRNEWTAEEGDGDYVAPEFLQNNTKPEAPADIFSLGVTMYECATLAKLPRSGAGRLPENVSMPGRSSELQQVIRDMIAEKPAERPFATEVVIRCSVEGNVAGSPPPSAAVPPLHRAAAADSPSLAGVPPLPWSSDSPTVTALGRGLGGGSSRCPTGNPCGAPPRLKRRSTQDPDGVGSDVPMPPRKGSSRKMLMLGADSSILESPDATPTKAAPDEMPSPSSVFASPASEKGPPGPTFSNGSPNWQNRSRQNWGGGNWGSGVFSVGSCASLASPCPSFTSLDGHDISLELSFDSPTLDK